MNGSRVYNYIKVTASRVKMSLNDQLHNTDYLLEFLQKTSELMQVFASP